VELLIIRGNVQSKQTAHDQMIGTGKLCEGGPLLRLPTHFDSP
jgi:hypothetical protein